MKTYFSDEIERKELRIRNFDRIDKRLITEKVREILKKDKRFAFKEYIMGPSEDVYFYQYDGEEVILWHDLEDGIEIRSSEPILLIIQNILENNLEICLRKM